MRFLFFFISVQNYYISLNFLQRYGWKTRMVHWSSFASLCCVRYALKCCLLPFIAVLYFDWSDSRSCRLLLSYIQHLLHAVLLRLWLQFFPERHGVVFGICYRFQLVLIPPVAPFKFLLHSLPLWFVRHLTFVAFALEWSGPWLGSWLPPQKMCRCEWPNFVPFSPLIRISLMADSNGTSTKLYFFLNSLHMKR